MYQLGIEFVLGELHFRLRLVVYSVIAEPVIPIYLSFSLIFFQPLISCTTPWISVHIMKFVLILSSILVSLGGLGVVAETKNPMLESTPTTTIEANSGGVRKLRGKADRILQRDPSKECSICRFTSYGYGINQTERYTSCLRTYELTPEVCDCVYDCTDNDYRCITSCVSP